MGIQIIFEYSNNCKTVEKYVAVSLLYRYTYSFKSSKCIVKTPNGPLKVIIIHLDSVLFLHMGSLSNYNKIGLIAMGYKALLVQTYA